MIFLISLKTLRSLCIDFIIFFIPLFLLWQALPHILTVCAPFIVGYLLFLAANPLNRRLGKVMPSSLSATLSLFLISFAVFFILRALFMHLFREISSFTQNGDTFSQALPFISRKMTAISTNDVLSSVFDAIAGSFSSLLLKFSSFMLGFAKNIPTLLISVFASIFTAFFLLKDYHSFKSFFRDFFGEKTLSHIANIKTSILDVIISYVKAQFLIGSIIFTVLFAGFFYLGIKYALILAFFTAIVDAVPILGTGAVLIPLSIYNFLTGESTIGWGLLILYGIALLVRQLCEPKIVGQKLGIHPLLTLFSLYAGLELFGVIGLIAGPISTILIKNFYSARKEKVHH